MNAINWWHVTIGALTVAAFVSCVALIATGRVDWFVILALTAAVEVAIYWLRRLNRPMAKPSQGPRSFIPFQDPTTVSH